ncbi:MAG: hypothetical protein LBR51_04490 [Bacteroidales bacterium]|jgi:hypothetical protein|nr:hypothetical protein [Bacteroidales bacterium]
MKKIDLLVLVIIAMILMPFFLFHQVYQNYEVFNTAHPFIMAFFKFGILATFGEMLGSRVKTGTYHPKGFGIAPRAIVWGFLGIWIAAAMGIFSKGVPAFLETRFELFTGLPVAMGNTFSCLKLWGAFFISLMMNTAFAPVFMTVHKITDTHILNNGGKISCLFKPLPVRQIITTLNWDVQWNFVFKKSIPFFWIPAHTITFILPQNLQVLFAAFCSIVLGLILSLAGLKKNKI